MDMHNKISYSIVPLLVALAAGSAWSEVKFFYNQVGYDTGLPINVIVRSDNSLDGAEFKLISNGNTVKSGKLSSGTNPDNWLNNGKFYVADLGTDVTAGTYTLQVSENGQPQNSGEFKIEDNALAQKTLSTVLDYFYNDRAENETIKNQDKNLPIYKGDGKTRDVHGGWYDASGDVSKYLSHLSYANYLNPQQIPLTVWALAFTAERIPALLGKTSTKAKTKDEAVYGADFLLRMLSEEGFFYMTVFDKWGNKFDKREICAFVGADGDKSSQYQTAFREGGGMAIAALARASLLKTNGDSTSEQYLAGAKRAYAHLTSKQSIGGNCEYCDDNKENIIDDYTALLAATELYEASHDSSYLKDAGKRAEHLAGRLSDDGYFWSDEAKTRPFWHASDAGLPLVALVRYMEVEANAREYEPCPANTECTVDYTPELKTAKAAAKKHFDWLLKVTGKVDNPFGYARQTYKTNGAIKDGFFIPHDNESNYWWQGESARIASLAAAVLYAHRILEDDGDAGADKYAVDQLDWILGKNPYATCMMQGKGTKNPQKYDGQSDFDATLDGGIANGISGRNQDGSGIAWDDDGVGVVGFDPEKEAWNNWRWIEQWLPHSTWYLMAVAVRYDEIKVKIPALPDPLPPIDTADADSSKDKPGKDDDAIPRIEKLQPHLNISVNGNAIRIELFGRVGETVQVFDLSGKCVRSEKIVGHSTTIRMPENQGGIYLVRVGKLGIRKIVIK